MRTLKEMVSPGEMVKFVRYCSGELFYVTSCGFEFPVPISDTEGASFLAEDRALFFMRYIRKAMNVIESARAEQEKQT